MQVKRQVLFVQGGGKGTHDEWDNKLVESLRQGLGANHEVLYPRMPDEDVPSFARWKPALQEAFEALCDGAVLVGHSVGGTILINVLAERLPACKVAAILLIAAPFVGDGGWPADELQLPADLGDRLPRGVPVHLFHGLEDDTAPPSHVDLFERAIPQASVHRLAGRDHQLNDDLREVAATISSL
jgi:predicted alpha/beta hydrolase family esterase